jgi:hypothetical protein
MAVNQPSLIWSRLHFVIRLLGVTGALIGCAGLVLAAVTGELLPLNDAKTLSDSTTQGVNLARKAVEEPRTYWPIMLLLAGAAAALVALLVEAAATLFFTAGRRSIFGLNAVLQGALAVLLLVAVNVWSFFHPLRLDFTRDQKFTLPPSIRTQLAQLDRNEKNKTTIVVYQRHKTFGTLTDKPDRYDYAAERKVVEKIKDLAEQLGHIGPQLNVEVLDIEDEKYEKQLAELTADSPALKQAIESAAENSIFIQSGSYLRQMSFNEFYQLDKVASREANEGRGNLVLLAQGGGESGRGVEAFTSKILNLQERRPRIGVLVVWEYFTTEGSADAVSLRALRRTLTAHGFDVRDVVLKKGWETARSLADLQPAAATFEESKLDRLEAELKDLGEEVEDLRKEIEQWGVEIEECKLKPEEKLQDKLDKLSKRYARLLGGGQLTALGREKLLAYFQRQREQSRQDLDDKSKERKAAQAEYNGLNKDRLLEARRMGDLKAKLSRTLAECDLLFVPRLTRMSKGGMVPNSYHRLSDIQVECIKEFMETGKPVLASFGPINEPPELGRPPDAAGADNLESLFGELGIRFGKQTVLFNTDSKSLGDPRGSPLRQSESVEPPPLDFDTPPEAAGGTWRGGVESAALAPNKLREALRVTAHSVGQGFDLRLRFPRPVYFEPMAHPVLSASTVGLLAAPGGSGAFLASAALFPGRSERVAEEPTFLLTANGWNSDRPFALDGRRPRYVAPKPDDPDNGTLDAKRRGPFPVGLAVETPLPPSWSSSGSAKSLRLAVIGQGEVFVGAELSPPRERLFLQTANWLLGRNDYLPRADHPWSYPRVPLSPDAREYYLWLWGTRLGLPVLFAYLGLVVLLMRRLR